MNIYNHNSLAWDNEVKRGNRWTKPVPPREIALARKGKFRILLTPTRPVPAKWLMPVKNNFQQFIATPAVKDK